MDHRCSTYAIIVKGLLDDINTKLEKYQSLKLTNEPDDNLIRDIYNGYLIQNGMNPATPKGCGNNILDFIKKLIDANPNWTNVLGWKGTRPYITSLSNEDVVEIINKVQTKVDARILAKGGRRSFKKRTTSTRKSIKRSRSNRRRYRRTARK